MQPLPNFYIITLAFILLVNLPVLANNSSQLPTPPQTGTPKGNPTPGTTRPQQVCPKTDKPFTALVANNNSDYTTLEYPSFWFYVPYSAQEISSLEFILLDERERKTIYKTQLNLTDRAGIIKFTLSEENAPALEANTTYRWYLMLNCYPYDSDEVDLAVDGWIRRVSAQNIPQESVWYDRIANTAQAYFNNPNNQEIDQKWTDLLTTLGYQWIISEPFIKSISN